MQNTCRRKERDAKDEITLTLRWSSARLAPYYSVQANDVLVQDEVDVELPRKRRELANECKVNFDTVPIVAVSLLRSYAFSDDFSVS